MKGKKENNKLERELLLMHLVFLLMVQVMHHIYKKCVLCKDADNGLRYAVNECAKLKNERKQLLKDLNNINI